MQSPGKQRKPNGRSMQRIRGRGGWSAHRGWCCEEGRGVGNGRVRVWDPESSDLKLVSEVQVGTLDLKSVYEASLSPEPSE